MLVLEEKEKHTKPKPAWAEVKSKLFIMAEEVTIVNEEICRLTDLLGPLHTA
jgi:hypothetical protein